MTPDEIRQTPCRRLSEAERERHLTDGAICVERLLDDEWLGLMRAGVERLIERSRAISESDSVFDLEPGHSAESPRLRRVSSFCDEDDVFWRALAEGPIGDVAVDLLGPNVKFYQSKLNFKWARGGAEVKWHQDQPFFPHTNHAVATFGVYLNDCGPEQGPLRILPGSHQGEIYDHYDETGVWRGEIRPEAVDRLPLGEAIDLIAPAGSMTVHNYRTVHGSRPNQSDVGRPLLLYVLSAADAAPYTAQPIKSRYEQSAVRGELVREIHHEPGRYRVPPDWSGGYTSIFAIQQQDELARKSA